MWFLAGCALQDYRWEILRCTMVAHTYTSERAFVLLEQLVGGELRTSCWWCRKGVHIWGVFYTWYVYQVIVFHGSGLMVCWVACTEFADRSKQILQPWRSLTRSRMGWRATKWCSPSSSSLLRQRRVWKISTTEWTAWWPTSLHFVTSPGVLEAQPLLWH